MLGVCLPEVKKGANFAGRPTGDKSSLFGLAWSGNLARKERIALIGLRDFDFHSAAP
jgi:hypothetical protein